MLVARTADIRKIPRISGDLTDFTIWMVHGWCNCRPSRAWYATADIHGSSVWSQTNPNRQEPANELRHRRKNAWQLPLWSRSMIFIFWILVQWALLRTQKCMHRGFGGEITNLPLSLTSHLKEYIPSLQRNAILLIEIGEMGIVSIITVCCRRNLYLVFIDLFRSIDQSAISYLARSRGIPMFMGQQII